MLKIGDKVRFTDEGLEIVFGSKIGLSHLKKIISTIVRVDEESSTNDSEVFNVEVDNPEFNKYLLLDICFKKVE